MKTDELKSTQVNGFTPARFMSQKSFGTLFSKRFNFDDSKESFLVKILSEFYDVQGEEKFLPALEIYKVKYESSIQSEQEESYPCIRVVFLTAPESTLNTQQFICEYITEELIRRLSSSEEIPGSANTFHAWLDAILMEERAELKKVRWNKALESGADFNLINLTHERWGKNYRRFYNSLNKDFKRIYKQEFQKHEKNRTPVKSGQIHNLGFFFSNQRFHYDMRLLCFTWEDLYFSGYVSVRLTREEIHRKIENYIDKNVKRFIIDSTAPNRGDIHTIMSYGKVAYTKSKKNPEGLTFKEYKKLHPTMKRITGHQLYERIQEYKLTFTQEPFVEITEEQYNRAMWTVPPLKRGNNERFEYFFHGEGFAMGLHGLYFYSRKDDKYYSELRSILMKKKEIIEEIETFLNCKKS